MVGKRAASGHGRVQAVASPTPEEIREACRAIQAAWSDDERRRRAGAEEQQESREVARVSREAAVRGAE